MSRGNCPFLMMFIPKRTGVPVVIISSGIGRLSGESGQAHYWVARCWMAVAEAGSRPTEARRRAVALADGDPAYRRLLGGRSSLAIRVLGDAAVSAGNQRLCFPTRNAEMAVFALASAGRAGIHDEDLIDRLWPEASADRGRARLRTLLWQVRQVIGREAWRVERRGHRLHLELELASFDLAEVRARAVAILSSPDPELDVEAAHALMAELDQPLLVGWRYEAWVEAEADRNAELVSRLDRRLRA